MQGATTRASPAQQANGTGTPPRGAPRVCLSGVQCLEGSQSLRWACPMCSSGRHPMSGVQSPARISKCSTREPLWRACSHRRTRRHRAHPLWTRTAQDSLQAILTDVDPQKGAVPSLQQSRDPRPVHCALPASVQHSWHETAKAHGVQFQGFPSRESRPIRICELGVAKSQGLSGAAGGHTAAAPVRVAGNAVVKGCELGWPAA